LYYFEKEWEKELLTLDERIYDHEFSSRSRHTDRHQTKINQKLFSLSFFLSHAHVYFQINDFVYFHALISRDGYLEKEANA
jgi:hypothetical protein